MKKKHLISNFITFAGLTKQGLFNKFTLFILLTVFLSSCKGYNKLLKSNDAEKKYVAAKKYYEKKNFAKAAPLLDDLLVRFKGDRRFEEVYYLFAYSKYGMQEIALAGYHFKNFYESFPSSDKAEEALYMFVYCGYLETFPYYLDPEASRKAMDQFQLFINIFPESPKVEECNNYMDELRGRLRKKALETARLYLKMEDYRAAILAFNNTIKDFPEVENRDEIQYLTVKCSYLLALNSVDKKKEERFKDVEKAYAAFVEDFGTENKYHKDALEYRNKATDALTKIIQSKDNNNNGKS